MVVKRIEIKGIIGTDAYGRQIRKSFYGNSKKEATKNYMDYLKQQESQEIDEKINFENWSKHWLEQYKKPNVSPQTYKSTYSIAVNILNQAFKDRKLASIRPIDVQQFFNNNALIKSDSLIKKLKITLNNIFVMAIENDIIIKNPMTRVKVPKGKHPEEKKAYTIQEYKTVLKYAKNDTFGLGPFILLKTGIRRGELLALQWSDIDSKQKTITINKAVTRTDGELKIKTTKNNRSRVLPVDKEFLTHLANINPSSPFIMGSFGSKKPRDPDAWNKRIFAKFTEGLQKAHPELPKLSIHEYRHTYGSVLYNSGTDIHTVSKLLGHSSIEVTSKIYVHTNVEDLRRAISDLALSS